MSFEVQLSCFPALSIRPVTLSHYPSHTWRAKRWRIGDSCLLNTMIIKPLNRFHNSGLTYFNISLEYKISHFFQNIYHLCCMPHQELSNWLVIPASWLAVSFISHFRVVYWNNAHDLLKDYVHLKNCQTTNYLALFGIPELMHSNVILLDRDEGKGSESA